MRVLSDQESKEIWREVYSKFQFTPSIDISITPFQIDMPHKVFALKKHWSEEQEKIVRGALIRAGISEAYALDWQHSDFLFSTAEEIPYGLSWYDSENGYQIYYPSFYPNGDYHFFMDCNMSEGFLGHPWRKEIWVFGEKTISAFEAVRDELDLGESE